MKHKGFYIFAKFSSCQLALRKKIGVKTHFSI